MLLSDEAFVGYVGEHFVGVAADDVRYSQLGKELKAKGEYRYLRDSLKDGGESIRQGIFVVSSSGKFLGSVAAGWPSYDPVESLVKLKAAKAKYDGMRVGDRVGKALGAGERSVVPSDEEIRPEMMKMVGNARYYDFAEMVLFDQRHPVYSKVDSVWFSREEARSMLPSKLEVGAEGEVGEAVVKRFLLGSHFMFGCQAWWEEHIREKRFKVKVLKVEGGKVYVSYEGAFFMDADSKWNKSSLRTEVLGKGVWDEGSGVFESLEFVSLGDVEEKELKRNMHRGKTKKTRVGAVLRKVES